MGDIDFSEGGEAPEAPAPEKKAPGGGGFPILKILMFVGIAIVGIALVITVVVVTVNIMDSKGRNQSEIPVSEEYQDVMPIYAYSSLIPDFQTHTADLPPARVTVKIEIGYDKGNKAFETELGEREAQLQDYLRNYFSRKTSADLTPENEANIKEELREQLNDMMKAKGVRDILFVTLDVNEM